MLKAVPPEIDGWTLSKARLKELSKKLLIALRHGRVCLPGASSGCDCKDHQVGMWHLEEPEVRFRSRRVALALTYLAWQLGCHEATLLKVCLGALTGDRDPQGGGALVVSRAANASGQCPRFRLAVGPGGVVFVALSHADSTSKEYRWGRQAPGVRQRRRARR